MVRWTPPRRLGVALSLSVLGATAVQAQSASAMLDWSKFSIEVVDTNLADGIDASFTIEYPNSAASGCLNISTDGWCHAVDAGIVETPDWTTPAVAHYALGAMSGSAGYDAAQLYASASGPSPSGLRWIDVSRSGLLTIAGDADVKLRLPYTLSVDATGADAMHGSFAYASLWIGTTTYQHYYISTPWDGTFTHSGTFELGWSHTGVSGGIGFGGLAYARLDEDPIRPPVPEPATWAMLLGGAALIARRAAARKA